MAGIVPELGMGASTRSFGRIDAVDSLHSATHKPAGTAQNRAHKHRHATL
jgi:hypothetical protein